MIGAGYLQPSLSKTAFSEDCLIYKRVGVFQFIRDIYTKYGLRHNFTESIINIPIQNNMNNEPGIPWGTL